MMTRTINIPEKPQDSMPCIEFGLRKDGEIDEKFSVKMPDRYGRLCESHPFANFVDKAVATATTYAHNKKRRQGYFTSPFLVRYALIGRDGRRLYLSKPRVMDALFPLPLLDHYTITERGEITRYFHLTGAPYFSLMMRVRELPQRWADKIENIDIYVSPQVAPIGVQDAHNNVPDTPDAESRFYRFASIDSRRFRQSSDFFNIPIASTYTPDIETKEPLDESQEIDEAQETRIHQHSSPFIIFLFEQQASARVYPPTSTYYISLPILTSRQPCLCHASGLSPPIYF